MQNQKRIKGRISSAKCKIENWAYDRARIVMNELPPLNTDLFRLNSTLGNRVGSVLNPSGNQQASVEEVAGAFEQIMTELMVKEMRKTVQNSEFFGQSLGEENYREFLDSLYVEMSVERGGLGLRDAFLRQLEVLDKNPKEEEPEGETKPQGL